ncbi:MAG: SMC-Scp complex subunit ScpB [Proteobacteria bacterium]|nr:SMC-Scp complex subunit ScpB [Pseudomonadota bacterium]
MTDRHQQLRLLEAVLFATREPLSEAVLAERMPDGMAVSSLIEDLKELYANRGVNLVRVAGGWAFRTASDLASRLAVETRVERKLSRAAIETLAIIAYHQPVTRAEIEEIRGVSPSRGTLDILLEAGWIRPGRRRRSPGRPLTWVSTGAFLDHFGLESLEDLPGIEDLKATGLLDARPAIGDFNAGLSDAELAEEEAEAPSGEEGDMARNAEDD